MKLLAPRRFRFHEDDRAQYGAEWWTYDEAALVRVPARELVAIEDQIGMSVAAMIARARAGYTDANLAAAWVARYLAGVRVSKGDESVPESFADFQPMVLLMEWDLLPGGDVNPPEQTSSPSQESAEA